MITDFQVQEQTNPEAILLGLAVESAVLDILTDRVTLLNCLKSLLDPNSDAIDVQIGKFGSFGVRLNMYDRGQALSIFVDGPVFEVGRSQSMAIWVDRAGLVRIIEGILGADASASITSSFQNCTQTPMPTDNSSEELTQGATVFADGESSRIRERYLEQFVDTTSDWYHKYVLSVHQYSDGFYYTGYLWDCMPTQEIVDFAEAIAKFRQHEQVLVMWDLHSCEKISAPKYWKFPRTAVIELSSALLAQHLESLPEDLYIFDRSFTWTVVLTHENKESGARLCTVVSK